MGEKRRGCFWKKDYKRSELRTIKRARLRKKDALTLRESINERAIMRLKSMREMELTREVNFS